MRQPCACVIACSLTVPDGPVRDLQCPCLHLGPEVSFVLELTDVLAWQLERRPSDCELRCEPSGHLEAAVDAGCERLVAVRRSIGIRRCECFCFVSDCWKRK